jgi:hypothetical protein
MNLELNFVNVTKCKCKCKFKDVIETFCKYEERMITFDFLCRVRGLEKEEMTES